MRTGDSAPEREILPRLLTGLVGLIFILGAIVLGTQPLHVSRMGCESAIGCAPTIVDCGSVLHRTSAPDTEVMAQSVGASVHRSQRLASGADLATCDARIQRREILDIFIGGFGLLTVLGALAYGTLLHRNEPRLR